MKSVWARTICRLLVVLMIWTPYQAAQAGMIGSDQAATASSRTKKALDRCRNRAPSIQK